jgi:hypothetical protein
LMDTNLTSPQKFYRVTVPCRFGKRA